MPNSSKELLNKFEAYLQNNLPAVQTFHPSFNTALQVMIKAKAKRFRPILMLSIVDNLSPLLLKNSFDIAVALEIFHTYSLIHDDLPSMDDAILRRGIETLHKTYDDATAILVGDALNTHTFHLVANSSLSSLTKIDIIKQLSLDGGINGMVVGQAIDIYFENKTLGLDELKIDPADIVKQNKIEELGEIFLDKIPFVRYIIDETILSYDTANPYQKKRCLDEISSYMRTLNKIVAQEYKTYISTKLNIKPQHIKIDSFQRKREDDISFVSKDIAELCIIKTALSNDECFDIVLDGLNSDMFLCHKDEFNMLLTNKTDQSLISISLTDDINILTLQELDFQISMMVTNYYKAQLLKIKQNTNMQFKQKVQKIKELQQKIKELKKS